MGGGRGGKQLHPAISWDIEKAPELAELAYRRFHGELVATRALLPLAIECGFLRVAEGGSVPLSSPRSYGLNRALWPLRGRVCGAYRFEGEQDEVRRMWWRVEPVGEAE